MMNSSYLKLFGGASIETPAGPLTGRAVQRHRLALLALLAVRGGMSRDKLVAWLWPDADTERARHLLSDSIYRINGALGGEAILSVADEVRLDRRIVPSDVAEFSRAIDAGELATAAGLYAGPFLDGFFLPAARDFEQWTETERAHFAQQCARALESLADSAERSGDAAAAVQSWRRLAAHEPLNARTALRLMMALEAAGDRAAAIRHARVHAALLEEELGATPDEKVMAYAEQLRAARPLAAPPGVVVAAETGNASTSGTGTILGMPAAGQADEGTHPEHVGEATDAGPVGEILARTRAVGAGVGVAGPGAIGSSTSSADLPARRPRWRSRAFAITAGTALTTALLFGIGRVLRGGGASEPGASIAVLPFVDVSPAGDNEYFSDGMTEELIGMLSRIEGVRVASRTSVFAYKARDMDVREIGRQLGVASVLEGSVRKVDTRLRITVNLVNAADGYQLWSDVYDRELADVFSIQEEISRAIVARLRGNVMGEELAQATVDPAAYNLYLESRFHWHQRTRESLERAVASFEGAVAIAPGYARAWIGLGDAHAVRGFYDYSPPAEAFPAAERAAQTALGLGPESAEAHATLGYVALYHHWDLGAAEQRFVRATTLDPGYSTGHQWYANLLTAAGRFAEAEREMRLAQEQDPLSLIANAALGWVLYHARDYRAAVDQCRRTLQLNPDFELAHLWMGWAYAELQQLDSAAAAIETALELSDSSVLMIASLARVLALQGNRTAATALLDRILTGLEYAPGYEIARVYAALGNAEPALQWLERAVTQRSHSIVFLKVDPQLDPLRYDARFTRLLTHTLTR